ncbi:Aldo/keto reductase family-domain-containing protein [Xylaria sp. FL1042]|nr:Aldo/keto reductase family-domain-containing protein [Xylaria sp. FL1042]
MSSPSPSLPPSERPRSQSRRRLHEVIPPLVMGTATFNTQYVPDPFDLPATAMVSRALDLGVTAFDTSPYYGPSETILGNALAQAQAQTRTRTQTQTQTHSSSRADYFLITKTGRIAPDAFDYSASWTRYSVARSLERLRTPYLDLVYAHDVEFVSAPDVLAVVTELRRLRDEEGLVRYVGISGYPVHILCELAETVLRETGEPLDAVLSYGHFSLQNTTLGGDEVMRRFADAGVDVVLNASMLGMGLLTTRGADAGPMASWHPSPEGLRQACQDLVPVAVDAGEKLEVVAIRWAVDNWAVRGAARGSGNSRLGSGARVGVSVMGISNIAELEETYRVFNSVIEGLEPESESGDDAELMSRRRWSRDRRGKIQAVVEKMWDVLGTWRDYSWESPGPGFVNARKATEIGVTPDDGILTKHKLEPVVQVNVEPVPALL